MGHTKKSDQDEPLVSPIEFYVGSNGEVSPPPPTRRQLAAYGEWRRIVEDKHKRLGMSRREFAESACGMAAALMVVNQVACGDGAGATMGSVTTGGAGGSAGAGGAGASGGPSGGAGGSVGTGGSPSGGGGADAGGGADINPRDLPAMTEDAAAAREMLAVNELVIDVQTHPPDGRLFEPWPPASPQQHALDYIRMTYVQSDVAVAVLTGWPSARLANEANVQASAILEEIMDRLGGDRFLFHANANPDLAGEPDYIERLADKYKNIAAWKTYPHASPAARLHQRTTFLERVRKTGIKIIACHRGLSSNGTYESPGSPEDVVRAALMFPDIKFLVYHGGYESSAEERHGYMDLGAQTKGVDRTVKAVLWAQEQNGGRVPANLFVDIGTTWAQIMSTAQTAANPGQPATVAEHVMGKLLKHLGPDQVLFGTDAYNGNQRPQPQILELRMFTVRQAAQDQFGYPAITPEVRRKILGENALKVYGLDANALRYRIKDDDVARLKLAYRADPRSVPMPHPRRHRGPRTRREFLAFQAWERRAWGDG